MRETQVTSGVTTVLSVAISITMQLPEVVVSGAEVDPTRSVLRLRLSLGVVHLGSQKWPELGAWGSAMAHLERTGIDANIGQVEKYMSSA